MADIKVYYPEEISDAPFPGQDTQNTAVTTTATSGVSQAPKTSDRKYPIKKIAVELLSSVLNTKSKKVLQEFTLVGSGGFRIGTFESGVSGDIAITPAGITARNNSGVTTFSLVGEDGSAVFAGEVQAGTFISGLVVVGDNRLVLDGEAGRIVVNDGNNNIIAIGNLDF